MMRIYRLALFLLPRAVRERHGAEMAAVFEQLIVEERQKGRRAAARAAQRELASLLCFAWHARRGRLPRAHRDESRLTWPTTAERSHPMRDLLFQDVRYAARLLVRTPGVTAACVVTMAMAIGANTAVFSLVHGVLLRPLPFPNEDRLVVLGQYTAGDEVGVSSTTPGNFFDWQARTTAFEAMAAFASTQRIVERGDRAERVLGALSVGSLFEVLQRTAAEGRVLTAADDVAGGPGIVVLAGGFARQWFGDAQAVGQLLRIGGVPYTVVGVMPADFAFPDYDTQYWIPARFDAEFRQNRDQFFLRGVARRSSGADLDQVLAQMHGVMDGIRREHPQATANATATVVPLRMFVVDDAGPRLWMLLGGVVLVLVIACANIANLLLARSTIRRREMAVRQALGARSTRLFRQMLTESLLLAAIGGAAGIAVGHVLLSALLGWMPTDLPRAEGVSLDAMVLGVTALVALACGVAFGTWPALQLSHGQMTDAVRSGARETGRRDPVRSVLVVVQVALSLTLLAGAGLLTRSLTNLMDVRPGFEPAGVLSFTVSLPTAVYREPDARYAFFTRALDRLQALPGVMSADASSTLPVAGRGVGAWFNQLDRPLPPTQTPPAVPYRVITPGYFTTLGIPVLEGRGLTEEDGLPGRRAVVISQAVARRFWPGESAVGASIYLGAPDNRLFPDAEIVGVVGDVKQTALDEATSEAVYIPHRLMAGWPSMSFVLRTPIEPTSLATAARTVLREIDPAVPVHDVRAAQEIVDRSLSPARSSVYLLGLFAVMALTLAVIGVFGVLSFLVAQRRAELAIRVAIGASSRAVQWLVLRQGLRQVGIGLALGLLLTVALARSFESLLFNVAPADPLTLTAVSLLFAAAAALAVWIPSRRATRVDPSAVLREG